METDKLPLKPPDTCSKATVRHVAQHRPLERRPSSGERSATSGGCSHSCLGGSSVRRQLGCLFTQDHEPGFRVSGLGRALTQQMWLCSRTP